ncbi:TPA: hypothetical protein DDX30_03600 [Candidatus Wolfebacteria bacterium]|nr:hypothetical protein [Candidatus Wolfebacteria bacterium]
MGKLVVVIILTALMGILAGCSGMQLVITPPVPLEGKMDYSRKYSPNGEDKFYLNSHIYLVNASQYKVRYVKNGIELPGAYLPATETELLVKNQAQGNVVVNIVAVAYDRRERVVGTASKVLLLSGDGEIMVEQWVLRDWTFQ